MTSPLRLAFAGTPDFAALHLSALLDTHHEIAAVFTQPDRPAGRGKQPRPSPVKSLALNHALPVLQPQTLRDPDVQRELADLDLDALIVVAYGLILPQAVLDIPRHGCINVHGSLLPRWRGAAPIQRAIEAGDAVTGITIMRMDAGLDTGPMLARASCDIPPLATSGDLYALLAALGPKLLCEVLARLPAAIAESTAQDDSLATYAHKIDKGEARLDWQRPAAVLSRQVRAFNPAPGCFTFLGEERIKVWRATPQPGQDAQPGTITDCAERGITVACGEGSLLLETLQFPGARAMDVGELLRGRSELLARGAVLRSEA